jgi:hypothetical protein
MGNTSIEPIKQSSENPLSSIGIDGQVKMPRCKLCRSPFRKDAERMFDENETQSTIQKFLKEKGEEYGVWEVRAHFDHHYKMMAQHAAILEYRDHLDAMMQRRKDMVEDTIRQIDISWTEMAQALAIPTGTDLDKMEKKQRIIAGYQKNIRESYDFLKSLADSEAKAKAVEDRFIKIWEIKLKEAKTDEEKKMLVATLTDFNEKLKQTEKP